MLAKSYRLSSGRDISRVLGRGKWGTAGPFTLKALPNNSATSRIVVVVSKKVSKRATIRNRIRRRMTALLADLWETVTPGYDIVITVRADIAESPADELKTSVETAARRINLITPKR